MVDYSGAVEDGPVPVLSRHLFLCEVGAGHLDEVPPGAFDKTVGALYLGRGGNDLGHVAVDTLEALVPHEFTAEVSMESAEELADIRP